jgi:hypothetical protein
MPEDMRPPGDDRQQHRIGPLRREHRDHARDAHLSEALHPDKILAEAEQADFDGGWIASGLPRHLAEFRQGLGDIAGPGRWDPIGDPASGLRRPGASVNGPVSVEIPGHRG